MRKRDGAAAAAAAAAVLAWIAAGVEPSAVRPSPDVRSTAEHAPRIADGAYPAPATVTAWPVLNSATETAYAVDVLATECAVATGIAEWARSEATYQAGDAAAP